MKRAWPQFMLGGPRKARSVWPSIFTQAPAKGAQKGLLGGQRFPIGRGLQPGNTARTGRVLAGPPVDQWSMAVWVQAGGQQFRRAPAGLGFGVVVGIGGNSRENAGASHCIVVR